MLLYTCSHLFTQHSPLIPACANSSLPSCPHQAIDHVASELMRKYNTSYPLIYTTYQCYLRDSAARLQADTERARRGGYHFGCKLVRGAYLILERERSAEMGYPSPIWDTIQDTHDNYNRCVEVRGWASSGGCQ
jgi:hypothetical protein